MNLPKILHLESLIFHLSAQNGADICVYMFLYKIVSGMEKGFLKGFFSQVKQVISSSICLSLCIMFKAKQCSFLSLPVQSRNSYYLGCTDMYFLFHQLVWKVKNVSFLFFSWKTTKRTVRNFFKTICLINVIALVFCRSVNGMYTSRGITANAYISQCTVCNVSTDF